MNKIRVLMGLVGIFCSLKLLLCATPGDDFLIGLLALPIFVAYSYRALKQL